MHSFLKIALSPPHHHGSVDNYLLNLYKWNEYCRDLFFSCFFYWTMELWNEELAGNFDESQGSFRAMRSSSLLISTSHVSFLWEDSPMSSGKKPVVIHSMLQIPGVVFFWWFIIHWFVMIYWNSLIKLGSMFICSFTQRILHENHKNQPFM